MVLDAEAVMHWLHRLQIRKCFFRCIALLVLAFPIQTWATPFDAIYVLGDSLSDQGNILTATTALNAFNPAVPVLPDPVHYNAGRFSNGPVYTDYLSQLLGVPLVPSLLGGTNFAFGGARTTYNLGDSILPGTTIPWSLNAETAAFASRGINDPNGLYILFSGSNDLFDILSPVPGLGPSTVPTLLNGVQTAIQAFKLAGAQTILVPNVPNLGLAPAAVGNPAISAAATNLSQQYDTQLHALLAAITGVNIIEFDTFSWLTSIVDDPASFGLSNVTSPCYSGFILPDPTASVCGNPDGFLFWDREHPTTVAQALLANQLFAAVVPVSEASTLPLVLAGLVFLGALRARECRKRRVGTHSK
jgi:outer membrane lipase/esterase